MHDDKTKPETTPEAEKPAADTADAPATEQGGRRGPEPTRYGDWEKGGIAVDF